MIHKVGKDQRDMKELDASMAPGARVRVCDPIVGRDDKLSAGFSEYMSPSKLEWTFDYDEVFFMLEGSLQVKVEGSEPVSFEAGDLGYIERGDKTIITVPKHAYFLHVTHPSWRSLE